MHPFFRITNASKTHRQNQRTQTQTVICRPSCVGSRSSTRTSFGEPFVVVAGHKHLLTIHNKPLKSAPPRLQRLLIKIHGYNFQLVYRSSCQMIIAGTLSRLPNPEKNAEIPLDVTADDIPTAKMMKGSTIWTSSTSAPENESS